MEFIKKMNAEVIYKKIAELEQNKKYKIISHDLRYVEHLDKNILNVILDVDGERWSVGLSDKIRQKFESQNDIEREKIVGLKLFHQLKTFTDKFGKIVTYYDVKFTQ